MPDYLMLLAPSANRVYSGATPELAAAELAVTTGITDAHPVSLAGVEYLGFSTPQAADDDLLRRLGEQSAAMGLFERRGELLAPHELTDPKVLDDDLVTIPKYQGKTNELFTRLLMHLALSQLNSSKTQVDILDPLAGRGTTLLTAWIYGHNGYGVELDSKAVEQMASYVKTYLRRKRMKHSAQTSPVRRDGRMLGQRFDAQVRPSEATHGFAGVPGAPELSMTVFTGDARDAASLFGKRRFDAIVTDAPYGVVHGASARSNGKPGGRGGNPSRHDQPAHRDRSPAALLSEAIPVWASQLRPGGVMGLSWNTYGLSREDLAEIYAKAGLTVCSGGAWEGFAHRVDSSIKRDLMVGVKVGGAR